MKGYPINECNLYLEDKFNGLGSVRISNYYNVSVNKNSFDITSIQLIVDTAKGSKTYPALQIENRLKYALSSFANGFLKRLNFHSDKVELLDKTEKTPNSLKMLTK